MARSSRGLGLRIFIPATRIRIPYRVQNHSHKVNLGLKHNRNTPWEDNRMIEEVVDFLTLRRVAVVAKRSHKPTVGGSNPPARNHIGEM